MFKVFKKNNKCNHKYINIGYYYELQLTEYRNCFDNIIITELNRCSICGKIEKNIIGKHEFVPRMYNPKGIEEEEEYIQTLRNKNILEEYELYLNLKNNKYIK